MQFVQCIYSVRGRPAIHFILRSVHCSHKMKENTSLLFCILLVRLSAGNEEGMVRLAGGKNNSEGRVEIFHNGVWGTVCHDDFDINDAHVVCRQLLFPKAAEVLFAFNNGDGNIWMNELACSGREMNVLECPFPGWEVHSCDHLEDVGVRCETAEPQLSLNQEYDLDHNTSLSHQLGELFDSRHGCDLNITVVVDNNTVETICAHSIILSLNSFFRTSQSDFSSLSITATANCSQYANNFVRYFYTRKIKFTRSSAHCILKMAFDWRVNEVHSEAANLFRLFLPEDPTFQSQYSFYEYAVRTDDEELEEVCLRYLAWNCEAFINSPTWTNLPFGLVKALLSRSDLVVQNETVILKGLERWAAAQENTTIPEVLLKLIRFPLIPAEDLFTLNGSQYEAGKLQGFQFNALPFMTLLNDLKEKQNIYTSRIYTGSPWSFTLSNQMVKAYKDTGSIGLYGHYQVQILTKAFQTPVHNSAYFAFHNMRWKTSVYNTQVECRSHSLICPSLPAVSLKVEYKNRDIPSEVEGHIRYSNRLVAMCEGTYVFHVHEFNEENLVFIPSRRVNQVYPCRSELFSYQLVVRPHYSTD